MQPGDILAGRFELEHRIGSGGMGEVFRARDLALCAPVAVKVLLEGRGSDTRRFTREAQVLGELSHPGIVRYIAHGFAADNQPFLVMEWLEGEDLSRRLRRAPLSIDEAVLLGIRVSDALSLAHSRGVVHRDLKPSNLFLIGGEVGAVKVLDFGIAQLSGATTVTKTGMVLGTPGYIAPEQARSGQPIDARADVFTLGCVLFRCLTGSPVWRGERLVLLLAKILFEEAPRVRDLRQEVPVALDALVAQMLAKDREKRPASAAAVAAALRALCVPGGASSDDAPLSFGPPSSVAPSSALTGSERRVLSVVLVGPDPGGAASIASTRIEEDLAVERAGDEEILREVAAAHGGRPEWLVDGSVLVLFTSAAKVATDQTAQAARCALALRAEVHERQMALATGHLEVGGKHPVGDAIERAEQLLSIMDPRDPAAHEPGRALPIAIDEVTAGLLDARFDVVKAPFGFGLRGERELGTGRRTLLGKPTSCVGRDAELAALLALWTECVEEPLARAVLLTAPAGIGKSRIGQEFIRRVEQRGEPIALWIGQSDPLRAGSSFALIGQVLRSALGIQDGEPAGARQQKIMVQVATRIPGAEQARVTAFLGELVGTPFPDEASTRLRAARHDAELMGSELSRAVVDFIRAEARRRTVLLILEDLHWGDLPTVRLLQTALRDLHDKPFMVLALARPEVHDVFPKLWASRGLQEIRLKGLPRKASVRLVRQVLGDSVGGETVERIVQQAEGHAFYLEELIRAVSEGKGEALPATVLAMVDARIVGLDPEARRVLRAASVFGEACWLGGVVELLGGTGSAALAAEWLLQLSEQEVLVRKPESRFPGEQEFTFRHMLLREGAYATLTGDDRALGHKLAGEWLFQRGETDPVILAEHFERGGDPSRAAAYFTRASEEAHRRWDLPASRAFAERGIACGASQEVRLSLLSSLCAIHSWQNEPGPVKDYAEEIVRIAAPGTAPWMRAVTILFMSAQAHRQNAHIMSMLAQVREVEPSKDAVGPFVLLLGAAILFLDLSGQFELAEALLRRNEELIPSVAERRSLAIQSLNITRSLRAALVDEEPFSGLLQAKTAMASLPLASHRRTEAFARMLIGMHSWYLGALEESERELLAAASAIDNLGVVSSYRPFCLSGVLTDRGSHAEARLVAERLIEDGRARAGPVDEAHGRWALANSLLHTGDLDGALREIKSALSLLSFVPLDHLSATAMLARIHLTAGHVSLALTAAADAMQRYKEVRACGFFRGSFVHLVYAEALHASGREGEARAAITAARQRLLDIAGKITDSSYKKSFLADVPENARTLALARSLGGEGA